VKISHPPLQIACPKGSRTPSVGQADIVGGTGDSATAYLVKK
jgi:hypothetical protein